MSGKGLALPTRLKFVPTCVDNSCMKGMERITSVRLAEALSHSALISNDKLTEALYSQDSTGIPFVEILVDSELVSEWDIAKVVVQQYQLPFIIPSSFEVNPQALSILPEDYLFEHRILPVDVYGSVLTISMPVLLPYKVLEQVQTLTSLDIFPFVGLISENLKILYTLFPEHSREDDHRGKGKMAEVDSQDTWKNIFDLGDEQVLKDLHG